MRIAIESADQLVAIEDRHGVKVPARVWRGVLDGGVERQLPVTRIAARKSAGNSALERELIEHPPKPMDCPHAFDLRFFLC
jgi:hypothetical protein